LHFGAVVTLDQLPLGSSAKVTKITAAGATKKRLMEMGLTPTALVEAIRWAPLGDPMDIKVRGYHLSLRREEAAAVEVSPS
jgi:Fe2+ transport system protein FeoA